MRRSPRVLGAAVLAESAGIVAGAAVVLLVIFVTNLITRSSSPEGASDTVVWLIRMWMLACLFAMFMALGLLGALVYVRLAQPRRPERAGLIFGAANLAPAAVFLLFVLSLLSALRNLDTGPAWEWGFILVGLGISLPIAGGGVLLGGYLGGCLGGRAAGHGRLRRSVHGP